MAWGGNYSPTLLPKSEAHSFISEWVLSWESKAKKQHTSALTCPAPPAQRAYKWCSDFGPGRDNFLLQRFVMHGDMSPRGGKGKNGSVLNV